jgi:hypothetical protein
MGGQRQVLAWFDSQLIHIEGDPHDGIGVDDHDVILLGLGLVQPVPHRDRLVDAAAHRTIDCPETPSLHALRSLK